MRISSASNYNYTNQNSQNKSQKSFGMLINENTFGVVIESISRHGGDALEEFKSKLLAAAAELGKMTYNNKQVIANAIADKENSAFISIYVECEGIKGPKHLLEQPLNNTKETGTKYADQVITALKKVFHNANPDIDKVNDQATSEIADAFKRYNPTTK